ncbi:MAG TPA: hypothetical protein DCF63_09825 [Planctomycetaceae bacterium]|nr:hypothetical protein [Planctomycetaceae bacterium]
MTFFTDAQIAADVAPNAPIRAQTINRIQQNISAAFAGDPGSPALSTAQAAAGVKGMMFGGLGSYAMRTLTAASDAVPFTANSTYTAAQAGFAQGTWRCMGGGGVSEPFGTPAQRYFSFMFLRIT